MHEKVIETHIVGEDTHQRIVRAEECAALRKVAISHVGTADAASPFNVVRTNLAGAYLLGCMGGEGRMLLEGRWRRYLPDMTSLAPARTLHTFHAVPSMRWQICWIRYTPEAMQSQSGGLAPLIAKFDPNPLACAIEGLHAEMKTGNSQASATLWVGLIEHYAARFSDPFHNESRLRPVWERVQSNLASPWTLAQLSEIAHLSEEHLRRLSQATFGRSPMQQLTHLRMQHAAHLLASTDAKIDDICQQVGYQSPFSFSNAFKRFIGYRPSKFRMHSSATADVKAPGF